MTSDLDEIKALIHNKALIFLSSKPRTRYELEHRIGFYLSKVKNFTVTQKSEIMDSLLDILTKANLINDDAYVEQYVKEKMSVYSLDSRTKARNFLMKKGISQGTAEKALNKIPLEVENSKIEVLAIRKLRGLEGRTLMDKKKKLISYILGKGFTYEQVRSVVDTILNVK